MHSSIFLLVTSLLVQRDPLQLRDYCESMIPAVPKHSIWANSSVLPSLLLSVGRKDKVSFSSGKSDHALLQDLPHMFSMLSLALPGAKSRRFLPAKHRAKQPKPPGFVNGNLLTNQHHNIKSKQISSFNSRPTSEAQMLVKMSISWLPVVEN